MIERKRRFGLSHSRTEVERFNKNVLFVSRKDRFKNAVQIKEKTFLQNKIKISTKNEHGRAFDGNRVKMWHYDFLITRHFFHYKNISNWWVYFQLLSIPLCTNFVYTLLFWNHGILAIKLNKVTQTKQMKLILAKPPSIILWSIHSSRYEMSRKNARAITSAGVAWEVFKYDYCLIFSEKITCFLLLS